MAELQLDLAISRLDLAVSRRAVARGRAAQQAPSVGHGAGNEHGNDHEDSCEADSSQKTLEWDQGLSSDALSHEATVVIVTVDANPA